MENNPPNSPEHWGDEDPEEDPEYWGEEHSFQMKPVLKVDEVSFTYGGLRIKDLRVQDKGTLIALSLALLAGAALAVMAI